MLALLAVKGLMGVGIYILIYHIIFKFIFSFWGFITSFGGFIPSFLDLSHHLYRNVVVNAIGREGLQRIFDLADVYHSENIDKLTFELFVFNFQAINSVGVAED
jgi:hypothetical protein